MKKLLLSIVGLFIAGNSWATCDISSAFTTGQVLTAAQLNTFVTDSENCTNNVLNGDTFTGNMSFHSGVDALFYSDTGTTLKASIDGATGHFIGAPSMEGFHTNCGISNSGTTLTFAGYEGTALSATNPCVVAIRSNTVGRTALAYFTANVTVTHGAASNTDGNLFGITDADWASTMPLMFGAIYDGTTPYFIISRLPYVQSGSASTALCQKDDTSCDAQLDAMILATGLTLGNWINLPITQLGWFDATYATAGSAWTFAVTGKNGFNSNYESVEYTLPTGQMGAESGKTFTVTDGGTTLAFASEVARYKVSRDGMVDSWRGLWARSANGADGTALRIHLPFDPKLATSVQPVAPGTCIINNVRSVCMLAGSNSTGYITGYYSNNAGDALLTDSVFANANDEIYVTVRYPAM